jgi:hypothetical protein
MRLAAVPVLCGAMVILSGCQPQVATTSQTLPGLTYASLAQLPDWSGWWRGVDGPGGMRLYSDYKHLYRPAPSQVLGAFYSPANIASHGEYCRPFAFVGHNGGFFEDTEFLFTPGRLTITNESGLLRRVDLDGRPLRGGPEESNTGTSVGQWDGKSLNIQTTGLNSMALFPENAPSMATLGKNASVKEKLWLDEKQQLVIETELTAPEMLEAPLKFTVRYAREPGHIVREHNTCVTQDRQIDPKTGLQRFDMTPPADLPPPPPKS